MTSALPGRLVDQFELGLDAPICLTWELTYACNLSCIHCLSSSGRRDPRELSTDQCKAVIDELERMQVFYVNIGGGEPTVRSDFWELVDYATEHHVGVKFSTNGVRITPEVAARLAAADYVDVQISLDGATAEVNDAVRGRGLVRHGDPAMQNLADAGFRDAKISVVVTRAQRRPTRRLQGHRRQIRRHSCASPGCARRAAAPTCGTSCTRPPTQQRQLYDWLVAHGDGVLTGDSFFHLAAYGESLPGLNLCGAGRVVCLIDPVGDVYACPFAIHENSWPATCCGDGGFAHVWRESELFTELRAPPAGGACANARHFDSCRGGCMAAKFFTGLPLDGPDPECVQRIRRVRPRPASDRCPGRPSTNPAVGGAGPAPTAHAPDRACDENPLSWTRCRELFDGENSLVRDRCRGAAPSQEAAARSRSTAPWSPDPRPA